MTKLILSFLLTVLIIVFAVTTKYYEKDSFVKKRIKSHIKLRDPQDDIKTANEKFNLKSIFRGELGNLTGKLRKYYNNIMSTQKEDEIQKKLLRAGSPFRMNVADYYIINNIIRVALPLLFLALALLFKLDLLKVILSAVIGFLLSFKTLDIYLNLKTKDRCKKALRELPDFLDILTIGVEAGLGFDLALSKTIEKRTGILPMEFHTCLEEMRLGKMRKDALLGIKERLPLDELGSFITSIIQSEKLGTGIVNTLRARSEDERYNRLQRAEEEAMKTTIKILFPLVLLIFPAIFIIILGPAAVQVLKIL